MAQHVLELAHNLATLLQIEDSIHYFQVIQTIINTPLSCSDDGKEKLLGEQQEMPIESWQREVLLIKIKTFLGLGFLHKELKQCDKAISFIDQAQDLNETLTVLTANTSSPVTLTNETFTFAKFSIHCRQDDIKAAEATLYVTCVIIAVSQSVCAPSSHVFHVFVLGVGMNCYSKLLAMMWLFHQ